MDGERERSRGALLAHGLWGLLGLAACLLLALVPGGHPPLMIFVPVAAAVWLVGHGAIWTVGRVAAAGRRSVALRGGEATPWPLALGAVLVLTGLAVVLGLVQLLGSIATARLYPFRPPGLWTATMVVWVVHGACFFGVLLRRPWSRALCAFLPLAWAAFLAWLLADHLAQGAGVDVGGLAVVVALIAALIPLGCYLSVSRRVRTALAARAAPGSARTGR